MTNHSNEEQPRGPIIEFKQPMSAGQPQPPSGGERAKIPAWIVECLIQQLELGVSTVIGYSDVIHGADEQGVSPSEVRVTANGRTQTFSAFDREMREKHMPSIRKLCQRLRYAIELERDDSLTEQQKDERRTAVVATWKTEPD